MNYRARLSYRFFMIATAPATRLPFPLARVLVTTTRHIQSLLLSIGL